MDVKLDEPAVDQLWNSVSDIITVGNALMEPFLLLFGVKVGNGLSPFAVEIDTPSQLAKLIKQIFKPPKRDFRGTSSATTTDIETSNEVVETHNNDSSEGDSVASHIIASHGREINLADKELEDFSNDVDAIIVDDKNECTPQESSFDNGNSIESLKK